MRDFRDSFGGEVQLIEIANRLVDALGHRAVAQGAALLRRAGTSL